MLILKPFFLLAKIISRKGLDNLNEFIFGHVEKSNFCCKFTKMNHDTFDSNARKKIRLYSVEKKVLVLTLTLISFHIF